MKTAFRFSFTSLLFACAALPVIFFSCTAPKYIYSPPTANLLQIESRKDMKLAVNYATAGNGSVFGGGNRKSSGADVQAAAAAGKRIAIRIDAYKKSEQNQTALMTDNGTPEEKNIYKKKGLSLAAGIYNFSKSKEASVFQLNGGIGIGRTSFTSYYGRYNGTQSYYTADYTRFFLQPAVIIKASEYYTGTIANTFSLMNYRHIRTDLSGIKNEPLGFIGTKPSCFSEFTLQNEFSFPGLTGIRFQAQLGVSKLLTRFSSDEPVSFSREQYDYHNSWFAAGVVADVNKLLRRK